MIMNAIVKVSIGMIGIALCVAIASYSPLAQRVYSDLKAAREESKVSDLFEANRLVRDYTVEGGALFASTLYIRLKLTSPTEMLYRVLLKPAYPTPPGDLSKFPDATGYVFNLRLHDKDSFKVAEIDVVESEMTAGVGEDGTTIESRFFEGNFSISIDDFIRIDDVFVAYASTAERRAGYERLRNETPQQIAADPKTTTLDEELLSELDEEFLRLLDEAFPEETPSQGPPLLMRLSQEGVKQR